MGGGSETCTHVIQPIMKISSCIIFHICHSLFKIYRWNFNIIPRAAVKVVEYHQCYCLRMTSHDSGRMFNNSGLTSHNSGLTSHDSGRMFNCSEIETNLFVGPVQVQPYLGKCAETGRNSCYLCC